MAYTEPTTDPVEPVEPVVEEQPFELPEGFADQVKAWDVPVEKLPEAVELFKALQTEEGTIDGFIRLGQNLGFGIKELERLFAEDQPVAPAPAAAPAPAEPAFDDDPDRLMTAAEVRQLMDGVRGEVTQSFEAQQAAEFARKQQTTFAAIEGWFKTNGIEDDDVKNTIARFGEKTIVPGVDSYDPAVAVAALERGKAQYDAFVEREAQAYLAKKAGTAQAQPVAVGGGTTQGGEGDDAPPNYSELKSNALSTAKQRVRERLRQSGELN